MILISIDFHNTLFQCDDWFRLEVETLPLAVMQCLHPTVSTTRIRELESTARMQYREIRQEAMRTGVECDAVTAVNRVFDHLQLGVDAETIEGTVAQVMADTVEAAQPLPGAVDAVRSLSERGYALAVVSSAAYHPFLEWCLTTHDMRDAFHHVVTSASCGIYKSDPRIYQHTLDLFACSATSSVHIGDSHRFDVSSASQVGMRTILLTPDVNGTFDPRPDAVIESLGEAEPHLDRLLNDK